MKLCKKKSMSLEDQTALVHLGRRHTLKEDLNEADSGDLRKTIRANSLGSFGEGPSSSTDIEAVKGGKPSRFTRRPTVITESELSSSLLYKDRKAKINSDDEGVGDPGPTLPPANHEDLEPRTLQDPKLMPTPVQRPRKKSSCCWYFTIVLVICIACLAIMAGVGGIVYMEYFANYKEKDTENANVLVKNDDLLASKEIFQHPSHKQDSFHPNEPKIPESILKQIIKNSEKLADKTDLSKKVTIVSSQNNDEIFHNKDLRDSKNSKEKENDNLSASKEIFQYPSHKQDNLHPIDSKISESILKQILKNSEKLADNIDISRKMTVASSQPINDIFHNKDLRDSNNNRAKELSSIVLENQDIEVTEHPETAEQPDVSRNIHSRFIHFNVPNPDQSLEINSNTRNQDSLDLNLQSKDIMDKIRDVHAVDKVNQQMKGNGNTITEKLNSIAEGLDSKGDTLSENFNFEMTTLQDIELKGEQVIPEISFQNLQELLLPNKSLDHMGNFINDNREENSLVTRKHDIDHDPKDNFLDHTKHSIDHRPNNSFDLVENSIDHNPNSNSFDVIEHSINPDDISLKDHIEDSSDFDSNNSSSEEHSLVDDQNQDSDDSGQLVFIRPIVESKAVPIPLAFLRRIGFDIKNPISHEPMTAKDMDIKFSLAEALKYLRSLDAENKLPVSRERTVTRKTRNQTETKKTKLPLKSEREEYLNLLRKHIFEESS